MTGTRTTSSSHDYASRGETTTNARAGFRRLTLWRSRRLSTADGNVVGRMAEKRCGRCVEVKPIDEFPVRRASPDGRDSLCRGCHVVANQAYRQRHRERLNAARRRDPIPERTCRTCGQRFIPVRKDQNYCRTWCRQHKYLTRLESESR